MTKKIYPYKGIAIIMILALLMGTAAFRYDNSNDNLDKDKTSVSGLGRIRIGVMDIKTIVYKTFDKMSNNDNVELDHMEDNLGRLYYVLHGYEFVVDNKKTGEGHNATWGWYYLDAIDGSVYEWDMNETGTEVGNIKNPKTIRIDTKKYYSGWKLVGEDISFEKNSYIWQVNNDTSILQKINVYSLTIVKEIDLKSTFVKGTVLSLVETPKYKNISNQIFVAVDNKGKYGIYRTIDDNSFKWYRYKEDFGDGFKKIDSMEFWIDEKSDPPKIIGDLNYGQIALNIDELGHIWVNLSDSNYKGFDEVSIADKIANIYKLDKPPFKYYCQKDLQEAKAKKISLKQIGLKKIDVLSNDTNLNNLTIDINNTKELRSNKIPLTYKNEDLYWVIKDTNSYLASYGGNYNGGRYLISIDRKTKEIKYIIDFENYVNAPIHNEAYANYEGIKWAKESGGILYVSNANLSYAKETRGMNAYITAIRISDMKVLWRSDPLVANSYNFCIINDCIVSGYGFTDESDYIYIINKNNGKVIEKLKVKNSPESFSYTNNTLYVRTYSYKYTFNVLDK